MNRHEFLKQLQNALNHLPDQERNEILQDFKEHFDIGRSEGKTDEEIAASLGSPHQLAKDIKANYHVEQAKENASTGNVLRATWAVIGLGFLNLVIVLGPLVGIAGIIVSLWGVAASFILQFLALLGKIIIAPSTFHTFELFFSITITGIGLLIALGMYFVTKYAIKVFIQYLNFNIRIVKGGMQNV